MKIYYSSKALSEQPRYAQNKENMNFNNSTGANGTGCAISLVGYLPDVNKRHRFSSSKNEPSPRVRFKCYYADNGDPIIAFYPGGQRRGYYKHNLTAYDTTVTLPTL